MRLTKTIEIEDFGPYLPISAITEAVEEHDIPRDAWIEPFINKGIEGMIDTKVVRYVIKWEVF